MYICVYMCVCVCVRVRVIKYDKHLVPAHSMIHQFKYSYKLIFGWNEFRKALYVSQVLSAPTRAIFGGVNNEMTN